MGGVRVVDDISEEDHGAGGIVAGGAGVGGEREGSGGGIESNAGHRAHCGAGDVVRGGGRAIAGKVNAHVAAREARAESRAPVARAAVPGRGSG